MRFTACSFLFFVLFTFTCPPPSKALETLDGYNFGISLDVSTESDTRFPAGVNTPPSTENLAALLNFFIEDFGNELVGGGSELSVQPHNIAIDIPDFGPAADELAALIGRQAAVEALSGLAFASFLDTNFFFSDGAGRAEILEQLLLGLQIAPESLRNGSISGLGSTDPFLAFEVTIANPFDEPATFRIEQQVEIDPLDEFLAVREGFFLAEVFDTGGDSGATLEYNLGFTSRLTSDGSELSTLTAFGSLTDADATEETTVVEAFIGAGSEIDAILGSAFLTLSPGDTARVQLIGSYGDDVAPIAPVANIRALLDVTIAAVESFRLIPEPSGASLLLLGSVGAFLRRPRSNAVSSSDCSCL